jgi:ADP-heptose:LPS heptosyltransferase
MRLLIIRTSAMGDVALMTPVLRGMRDQYPDVELNLVTRAPFSAFFNSFDGLRLFSPDFNKRHKGIAGLFRLFRDIHQKGRFDHIIDLHDVLRTKFLRILFMINGEPVKIIDKGRRDKKMLIKGILKKQLKHSVERYCDVFSEAGFDITLTEGPWLLPSDVSEASAAGILEKGPFLNIGVAPYAKHDLKMWPEEYMVRLLSMITEIQRVRFWLFGGREDKDKLEELRNKVKDSVNLSGKLTLDEEIAVIARLDFMIAMDSANMHMAALAGTKVISIWGTTDPLGGFGAWGQPEGYSVSIPVEELTCRPCTIYGKGECWRGDHACMVWLTPEVVLDRLKKAGLI